jgi:hypothetical protein
MAIAFSQAATNNGFPVTVIPLISDVRFDIMMKKHSC